MPDILRDIGGNNPLAAAARGRTWAGLVGCYSAAGTGLSEAAKPNYRAPDGGMSRFVGKLLSFNNSLYLLYFLYKIFSSSTGLL